MFDTFVKILLQSLQDIADHRNRFSSVKYSISDSIMSVFAMFSLKDASLLSFIEKKTVRKENLRHIYKIEKVPSENGLRNILDPINPSVLQPSFKRLLSNDKVVETLKAHKILGGYTAIAIDGTQYFTSNHTQCPHCMVKKHKDKQTGEVKLEYYHQLLGACIVKPNNPLVYPVAIEPISKKDGSTKNDCEYNAFKRIVPTISEILPHHKALILLDGLYATGPAIKAMQGQGMDYISVIKEGYVLVQVEKLAQQEKLNIHSWKKNKYLECTVKWANNLILNGVNADIKVNYVEYKEVDTRTNKITYKGKWITSLSLEKSIGKEFVSVARSRWKIENETFNVLKKKGYNLEHNYGHGKKYLSSLFATIMFLAFLVDQLTAALDINFKKAKIKAKTMVDLREKVRVLFDLIPDLSMNIVYQIIAREIKINFSP